MEEYVQGDTSGGTSGGRPSDIAAEARQITRQLCSALWVLHSMGVVHRDVKPDNVIIRGKEAVLIDFDASRIYKNAITRKTHRSLALPVLQHRSSTASHSLMGVQIFMRWAFCSILC